VEEVFQGIQGLDFLSTLPSRKREIISANNPIRGAKITKIVYRFDTIQLVGWFASFKENYPSN
jgi:hypothetical protein